MDTTYLTVARLDALASETPSHAQADGLAVDGPALLHVHADAELV